ncbi:AraC family transcriptional regulator [Achromobacter denitrificans]|uniref:AraC family transcriptional regulator n=1 Tax=Achromobacter denitrificans TaxID=32002 RepID=UPI000F4FD8B4|nr:AraC family transcriptional regulator [Achromobacter denitrificans]MDX3876931.1 AraC family transcriptional regulator [Achromobacter sp.]MBV2159583.1 AraC family transcriptional regulator [Achromobacter denitrificans]MPT37961.1 AraC family transcriptional regulator [Achromobacter sp.]QCS63753.1 AraC family transcriptional regulator [Achromobacter denitrificans]RSE89995.1 AraC family transcriptional regulator [Achromobacter denitrificans]
MNDVAFPQVDRLSALLDRFRVRATLFHTGALCGTQAFEAVPGRGFLHVLRRGQMELRHRPGETATPRIHLNEPTLLFYPRALRHEFVNPPVDGSDFTCAALDFDGGDRNPLVRSLPPLIRVPLAAVEGLAPALDLLFAEADHVRCGSRLLADRLFEVVLIQLLRWILDHPGEAGVTRGLVMGLSDPRLARALVAVHRAPCDEWPLAKMAEVAGMSRSAFAAAFKEATGATPAAYLTDWRLSLAASMVRAGRPVKLVAAELGFASASSLSKAFRQRMGASPRSWLAAGG